VGGACACAGTGALCTHVSALASEATRSRLREDMHDTPNSPAGLAAEHHLGGHPPTPPPPPPPVEFRPTAPSPVSTGAANGAAAAADSVMVENHLSVSRWRSVVATGSSEPPQLGFCDVERHELDGLPPRPLQRRHATSQHAHVARLKQKHAVAHVHVRQRHLQPRGPLHAQVRQRMVLQRLRALPAIRHAETQQAVGAPRDAAVSAPAHRPPPPSSIPGVSAL